MTYTSQNTFWENMPELILFSSNNRIACYYNFVHTEEVRAIAKRVCSKSSIIPQILTYQETKVMQYHLDNKRLGEWEARNCSLQCWCFRLSNRLLCSLETWLPIRSTSQNQLWVSPEMNQVHCLLWAMHCKKWQLESEISLQSGLF